MPGTGSNSGNGNIRTPTTAGESITRALEWERIGMQHRGTGRNPNTHSFTNDTSFEDFKGLFSESLLLGERNPRQRWDNRIRMREQFEDQAQRVKRELAIFLAQTHLNIALSQAQNENPADNIQKAQELEAQYHILESAQNGTRF